jgi:predicted nucleic acid-binding protein
MIDEDYSKQALTLLQEMNEGNAELLAPTIMMIEIANTLNTYVKRGVVKKAEAQLSLNNFSEIPITYVETDWEALKAAFEAALTLGLAVYDAVYLVLAKETKATMITVDREILRKADRRFSVIDLLRLSGVS